MFTRAVGADSDALMGVEWLGAMVVLVAFERKINSQMKNTMQCLWFDIKMHYAKRESRIVL